MKGATRQRLYGWQIRILTALGYLALVLWGLWRVLEPSPNFKQAYLIQRAGLPPGHRIRSGDLDINPELPPNLQAALARSGPPEGRYLTKARTRFVGPDDLADSPPLPTVTKGHLTWPFQLANEWTSPGYLDVGSRVRLFGAGADCLSLRIAAIFCATSAASCTAFLEVTPEQAKLLAARTPGCGRWQPSTFPPRAG